MSFNVKEKSKTEERCQYCNRFLFFNLLHHPFITLAPSPSYVFYVHLWAEQESESGGHFLF